MATFSKVVVVSSMMDICQALTFQISESRFLFRSRTSLLLTPRISTLFYNCHATIICALTLQTCNPIKKYEFSNEGALNSSRIDVILMI